MSLLIAGQRAFSGLSVASEQLAIVARNVGAAGDADASRTRAEIVSTAGGPRVVGVARAESPVLFTAALAARSDAAAARATADTLGLVVQSAGEPGSDATVSAMLARLRDAMQLWSASPADVSSARNAVSAASVVAGKVNAVATDLTGIRAAVDRQLDDAVSELRDALASFGDHSGRVAAQGGAADVTGDLDARDRSLAAIAGLIGVKVVGRAGGDPKLTTRDGIMLLETEARPIEFVRTGDLSSGRSGASVRIDGVPLEPGGRGVGGRIGALLALRDDTIPRLQAQHDELARVLVATFAEAGLPGPEMPGLLDLAGTSGVPAVGAPTAGMALAIRVNPAVDPAQGGRPERVRDGGATGPDDPLYIVNPGGSGWAGRLAVLVDRIETPLAVDPALGLGSALGAAGLARAIGGALAEAQGRAVDAHEAGTEKAARAAAALSGEVGANLDTELGHMLELERSYQASARLLSTVDQMLAALLAALD